MSKSSSTSLSADFIEEPTLLQRFPVSRRTAISMRNAGKLPFLRVGRRVLYHWPTVEAALIRQQKIAA